MRVKCWWVAVVVGSAGLGMFSPAFGGEGTGSTAILASSGEELTVLERFNFSQWRYGGFLDLGYSLSFNFPDNRRFRSRGTTPRVNQMEINMGGAYIKKEISEQSRWGADLLVHGGEDSRIFGFGVNQPQVSGGDFWRHFGHANLSYLAPVGNGLTVQAGLFDSLIGYESLYAKDNFNYTRAWVSDYSPYLMFGANAVYPFNDRWTGALFVINDYFHLQNANNFPSYGAQVSYKPDPAWRMQETIYFGPDQARTALEFWRFFAETLVEWQGETVTLVGQYQIGTQKDATNPGNPQSLFMGAAFPIRWHIEGPWSAALRPELYWDRDGLMTGFQQFIWAVTTTVEYRLPYRWTTSIFRLEYRYDHSTGSEGGFFRGEQNRLVSGQNLLIFSAIWTFDSP